MVPATLPFAAAAAFFPAGLAVMLWLLATPPGIRRGVLYLTGAATSTVGSGVLILLALHGVEAAPGQRSTIEGAVQLAIGAALLVLAVVLLVRRPRSGGGSQAEPRLSGRGQVGIFLLGVTMWTPSFAYLAALQLMVDSNLSLAGQAVNLAVVDVVILAELEIPLLLHHFAAERTNRVLGAVNSVLGRYAWQIGSAASGLGGAFLVGRGWWQLR